MRSICMVVCAILLTDIINPYAQAYKITKYVEAFPQELNILEGNALYVRLRNPTSQYDTCKLFGPDGNEVSNPVMDTNHIESCGFIVKSIGLSDQGTWEIEYGSTIIYRAPVDVFVIEKFAIKLLDVDLVRDMAADQIVGPENAAYCRLEDPTGFVVFDDFGQCRLVLKRVVMAHSGAWTVSFVPSGRILFEVYNFVANVRKVVVNTAVENQQPSVALSCSVPSGLAVRACKFRDPLGAVLIVTQGVADDRHIFDEVQTSYISNVTNHTCVLHITNSTENELGMWRCSVETNFGTHYGFLSVVSPWLMEDPEVQASVLSGPSLTANRQNISTIEGEEVTMSCSIQSAIRYCYFRTSNGTVFSVSPKQSSSYLEYVGDGFDAGDCGVRFKGLMASDSGNWTCHVGFTNKTQAEQRAQFQVTVQEPITVRHYWHEKYGLVVEASVYSQRMLRYCRFVRFDGLGFTPDNMPAGYRFIGSLDNGHCLLQIEEATIENMRPWTIAVKIVGHNVELSRQTTDDLHWYGHFGDFAPLYLWLLIMLFSLLILLIGIWLGFKNRKLEMDKANVIGIDIRNSKSDETFN